GRLEFDPGGDDAILFRRSLPFGQLPAMRPDGGELLLQHLGHLLLALQGLDVPGEADEVAPIALLLEKLRRALDIAIFQGLAEVFQKRFDRFAEGSVEQDAILPWLIFVLGRYVNPKRKATGRADRCPTSRTLVLRESKGAECKRPGQNGRAFLKMVEPSGIEPLTSTMPL